MLSALYLFVDKTLFRNLSKNACMLLDYGEIDVVRHMLLPTADIPTGNENTTFW